MALPAPWPTNEGGSHALPGAIDTMNMANVTGDYFQHSNVNITNNHFEPSSNGFKPDADCKAEVLSWLDAPNFRGIYQSALEQRLGDTGTWFIQTSEFRMWAGGKGSTLWITGLPGSGKTVLGSIVVHHLETSFQHREDVGVAFAFLRYTETQSGFGIMAALLSQLIEARAKALEKLQPVYRRISTMRGARLTVQDVRAVLAHIAADFRNVYVVIDGFDEASDMAKNELSGWLPLLGFNLLVLSRPLDLFCLDSAAKFSLQARTEDIEVYITERISLDKRLSRMLGKRPDAEMKLRERIEATTGGMFLLAKLQMDEIVSSSNSIRDLFEALESLPAGLEAMYGLTLARIGQQAPADVRVAHRVLNLLLQVAKEENDCVGDSGPAREHRFPPSTEDIQWVIAADFEQQALDDDSLTDVELILSACCGLVVEVDAPQNLNRARYKTLRFIHYTTEGYIERAGITGWENTPTLSQALGLVASLLRERAEGLGAPKETSGMSAPLVSGTPLRGFSPAFPGGTEPLAAGFSGTDLEAEKGPFVRVTRAIPRSAWLGGVRPGGGGSSQGIGTARSGEEGDEGAKEDVASQTARNTQLNAERSGIVVMAMPEPRRNRSTKFKRARFNLVETGEHT